MKAACRRLARELFCPPYPWLPWAIWLYVAACCAVAQKGSLFTGHLFDFDSHVRMMQVLNWINNPQGMLGGWYDRTITRTNAPEGFTTIWSRIVDIPIAAVIIVAQQFVSQRSAALVAAVVVPMAELAVLFRAMAYFARPLVGKDKANLAVPFVIFTSILNLTPFSSSGFFIGQASHHAWYVILDVLLFGATARIVAGGASNAPVLMMGVAIALLNMVGIEGFPMIAIAFALLALTAWLFARPQIALRGAAGALCGAVGNFVLLPLHQPPTHFFLISFAEPSVLGPTLVGCGAFYLRVTYEILQRSPQRRWLNAALMLAFAAAGALDLIGAFPDILNGGAAGLSPAERAMAFHEHLEARPIYKMANDVPDFLRLFMPLALALSAGIYAIVTARGKRRRALLICYFGFATLAAGMSALYSRYYHHAMTTACLWLLWAWERIKKALPRNDYRGLWAVVSFIALAPFPMLLLPAIAHNEPVTTKILLFPVQLQFALDPCDPIPVADFIDAHYPPETSLLVTYWKSAEFLYNTDVHIDFLALYPSQDKFVDNYAFFGTHDPEKARGVAAGHGVDLVAICKSPYVFEADKPAYDQMFLAQLQAGIAPRWLKQVAGTENFAYRLYAVDHALVGKVSP
ncbi:MAG: hypothetical protein P4M15_10505 [Alphaproteobacteria bacterium]|nr:hypothetical protein [Alphaproteobacteria bacterium]